MRATIILKVFYPEEITEGCMREQATLEFHWSFGDVLLHKLVKTYKS